MVAVEPDAGMRRLLAVFCPESEAMDGRAEQIPLAVDSVDAVFVGQAFHWFDNEAALTEIARVLRPPRSPCRDVERAERTDHAFDHCCRAR